MSQIQRGLATRVPGSSLHGGQSQASEQSIASSKTRKDRVHPTWTSRKLGCHVGEHVMPRHFHHNKTLVENARRRLCCVFFGLALVVSGCAAGTTRKTASVRSAKGVEVSAAEFSSRNQSLLALYSGEVEAAADKIISESPSP